VLPLTESHEFFALQDLELNGTAADDQEHGQEQYFRGTKAPLITLR